MYCPKCSASVADDSNFCPRCGTPFQKRPGFVATLWRDNKPGFVILSLLLIAMLGSIGYYVSTLMGKFVVTVKKIDEAAALEIVSTATVKEYCRQFPDECQSGSSAKIEIAIKKAVPRFLNPLKSGQSYAKISYNNSTNAPVMVTQFKYRRPPGPWTTSDSDARYSPRIQTLRAATRAGAGSVAFETKVELALTTAATTNHGSFTLGPGEEKVWRLSNVNQDAEFQIDFTQANTPHSTPILRLR